MAGGKVKSKKDSIRIISPQNHEHHEFIQDCFNETDFRMFIGILEPAKSLNYSLFTYRDKAIGVCSSYVSESTGVRVAYPSIFLTKVNPILSVRCMQTLIASMFCDLRVDKVTLIIYGNNQKMLDMIEHTHFKKEGVFRLGAKINRQIVDVNYFSMLRNEFDSLRSEGI